MGDLRASQLDWRRPACALHDVNCSSTIWRKLQFTQFTQFSISFPRNTQQPPFDLIPSLLEAPTASNDLIFTTSSLSLVYDVSFEATLALEQPFSCT